ncbi:hypothetical protein [Spirosoma areae]
MNVKICCLLVSVVWLTQLARSGLQHISGTASVADRAFGPFSKPVTAEPQYTKSLQFNVYRFAVMATDTGRVRNLNVKAYRGELLLTNFSLRVDGAVVGAEVADLDNNRFPELYIYCTSYGSGSFGRLYAWQFLPERKADVTLPTWRLAPEVGYMGHDSLWVERDILCRKYPVYRSGDANAEPSGGYRMVRYRLQSVGAGFSLVAAE